MKRQREENSVNWGECKKFWDVEDPIEVKCDGEPITENSQDPIDFLKNTTTQYIDILGVVNFNFVFNSFLIEVVNKLKANEKKFNDTISQGYNFQSWIK